MKLRISTPVLALLAACTSGSPATETSAAAPEAVALDEKEARLNYAVGYQVGGDFRRQGVELDLDAVLAGVADAMGEEGPKLSMDKIREELIRLKAKVDAPAEDTAAPAAPVKGSESGDGAGDDSTESEDEPTEQ